LIVVSKQVLKSSASRAKVQRPQIFAVQVKQVKHEVDDVFGAGAVEGVLQRVELRKPIIAQHYYLAIEPCGLGREERDLARKVSIFVVQSLPLRVNRRASPLSHRARMR
jgi:hypothetical protein